MNSSVSEFNLKFLLPEQNFCCASRTKKFFFRSTGEFCGPASAVTSASCLVCCILVFKLFYSLIIVEKVLPHPVLFINIAFFVFFMCLLVLCFKSFNEKIEHVQVSCYFLHITVFVFRLGFAYFFSNSYIYILDVKTYNGFNNLVLTNLVSSIVSHTSSFYEQ